MSELYTLLKTTKVEDVAPPTTVHLLSAKDPIIDGLKKLVEEGIVSAPVYNEEGTFLGLVDALDILAYTCHVFEEDKEIEQSMKGSLFARLSTEAKFAKTTIGEVTDFAHNPYTPLKLGSSVLDAVHLFVNSKSHRCPIVNEAGEVVAMLTQATVLNLIASKIGLLGDLGNTSVQDLDIGTHPVVVVKKHERVIDTLKLMHEMKVSGIAVVDDHNNVIGNISARDIKAIDAKKLGTSLYMSASNFIQRSKQSSVEEQSPAIACTPQARLSYVIGKLAANRIHRLYVCEGHHAVRIISLRDLMTTLYAHVKEE